MLRTRQAGGVLLVLLAIVLSATAVIAQEEGEEDEVVTLQGLVSVARDADGTIISVKLVTDDEGTYQVDLDDKGVELGETMEGKKVEVKGVVMEQDGEKWLIVHSFSEVTQ